MGIGIKSVPNGHIAHSGIFDCARTSAVETLSSNYYEGGVLDISILPGRAEQMGGPLTESEQYTLRSEFGELTRVAGIARPVALYGASVSAQNCEAIVKSIINPIDFGEIADANLAGAANAGNYPRMPGFEEYGRKYRKWRREESRANLTKEIKKVGKSKTRSRV